MVETEGQRPSVRSEDRPRFLRRRVSPIAHRTASLRRDALNNEEDGDDASTPWNELPESLVALILQNLENITQGWQTVQSLFAMSTVCRSWKQAAAPRLFRNLWEGPSPMTLTHPAQLFALSPRAESAMIKCYIVRESQTGKLRGTSTLYRLFLGNDPSSTHSKFLLSATQHPWCHLSRETIGISGCCRQHTSIFLTYQGTGLPCAKMVSNVLGTSHKLTRCEPSFFSCALSRSEVGMDLPRHETLASVKYKLRMKGMMRPRRLHVSLPKPLNNSLPCGGDAQQERRQKLMERLCHRHRVYRPIGDEAEAETISPRSSLVLCKESVEPRQQCVDSSNMKLVNKPPHWNEGLKCWCLNFRGRVKLASVKNFQLICDSDGAGKVVMQFGKVDTNVFIMDFNPSIISTVQAFSIALTSFEGKVLL